MSDYKPGMRRYLDREIATLKGLNLDEINDAIDAVMAARERGGVIYTMGNGGSASTASHMAGDFSKGVNEALSGKKFRFECLSDNIPTLMSIANDFSYADIFVYQLRNKLRQEDLVIAISGSGNSENVVRAVEYAKELGVDTIGITGYSGGRLRQLTNHHMHVNIDDMQISEDIHLIFDHMLMRVICESVQECASDKPDAV